MQNLNFRSSLVAAYHLIKDPVLLTTTQTVAQLAQSYYNSRCMQQSMWRICAWANLHPKTVITTMIMVDNHEPRLYRERQQ